METLPEHSERRAERYRQRELLRGFTGLKRLKGCGAWRARAEHGVPVYVTDEGVAHYGNLQHCASVHACPVCAPRIRQHRADEVRDGAAAWLDQGGGIEFVTVTLPHSEGDRLAPLLKAVRQSWRVVLGGQAWMDDQRDFGVVGTIRALEVNHGPNGWHPHLHVLVFTRRPLHPKERSVFAARIGERWAKAVVSAGYRKPSIRFGSRVVAVSRSEALGDYLSKVYDEQPAERIGLEVARGDLKRARRQQGYRSAFAIAADLAAYGDVGDLELWWEYERATKGVTALRWSKGLRGHIALAAALTDQEVVDQYVGGTIVTEIEPGLWSFIIKRRGVAARLLEIAEHDPGDLCEYLCRLDAQRWASERPPGEVLSEAAGARSR